MPPIVRNRMQDGKKVIGDQTCFATIIWLEVEEFDFLVKKYQG